MHQFIKGASVYRAHFIDGISEAFLDLGLLSDSLKQYSPFPEAHDVFRQQLIDRFTSGEMDYMEDAINESLPGSIKNEKGVRKAYKQWGLDHLLYLMQFHFLVSNALILPTEPFRISGNTDLWEEIRFYGLKANQTLIDVGAGIGGVSFLLVYAEFALQLYLTEVNEFYLEKISSQLNEIPTDKVKSNLELVMAREKTLGLNENVKADYILLREVFHHLGHPKEILASAKKHLAPSGSLILVESVVDFEISKKEGCNKAMTLKKILKEVTENGFVLVEQKRVAETCLLKFQMTKN